LSAASEGSVTRWIGELKSGGDAAAQHLWERYFDRLVRLAHKRLRARAAGAAEDEEDAALCAFDSFCRGVTQGRYPQLADRDDLWRLLVVITIRKAFDQIERRNAQKRGRHPTWEEADLPAGNAADVREALDAVAGREPSPELAAMVADLYQRLRSQLGNDSLRRVLDLRLEGFTREEIASRMGCTVKTVARKLEVIRTVWLEHGEVG
jgi:DNA-directed RNA polymerase specialized sigma24 family protein